MKITPTLLKRVRKTLGETQGEFGRRFNVNQSTVHHWETAGVPATGTARIAVEYVLSTLDAKEEIPLPQRRAR